MGLSRPIPPPLVAVFTGCSSRVRRSSTYRAFAVYNTMVSVPIRSSLRKQHVEWRILGTRGALAEGSTLYVEVAESSKRFRTSTPYNGGLGKSRGPGVAGPDAPIRRGRLGVAEFKTGGKARGRGPRNPAARRRAAIAFAVVGATNPGSSATPHRGQNNAYSDRSMLTSVMSRRGDRSGLRR